MNEDKITSPHGDLQAMLSQLGRLSPRRRVAPAFTDRQAAEQIVAVTATAAQSPLALAPVWAINHDDLVDSEIVAWTVVTNPN